MTDNDTCNATTKNKGKLQICGKTTAHGRVSRKQVDLEHFDPDGDYRWDDGRMGGETEVEIR